MLRLPHGNTASHLRWNVALDDRAGGATSVTPCLLGGSRQYLVYVVRSLQIAPLRHD